MQRLRAQGLATRRLQGPGVRERAQAGRERPHVRVMQQAARPDVFHAQNRLQPAQYLRHSLLNQ